MKKKSTRDEIKLQCIEKMYLIKKNSLEMMILDIGDW